MTAAAISVQHEHDTGLVQAHGLLDPPVLVQGRVCEFEAHHLVVTYRRTRDGNGHGWWDWTATLDGSLTGPHGALSYTVSTSYTSDDDFLAVPDYVRNYILARHPEVSNR